MFASQRTVTLCWNRKCKFGSPTEFVNTPERHPIRHQPNHPRQFGSVGGYSPHSKNSISSHVSHLLLRGGPPNISGKVTLGVVNPLNRKPFWSFTNVSEKVGESHPPITDRNPPASVMLKRLPFRIGASLNHGRPSVVFWRKRAGVTVSQKPLSRLLVSEAPARSACASSQGTVENGKHLAAVTSAHAFSGRPAVGVNVGFGISDDFKLSKPSTDEGYFCGHNDVLSIVLFSGGRPAVTGARYDYSHKTAMGAQA